jgi:hypothetical protein
MLFLTYNIPKRGFQPSNTKSPNPFPFLFFPELTSLSKSPENLNPEKIDPKNLFP